MTTTTVELAEVDLPEFASPSLEPTIPAAEYEQRIADALLRMADVQLDFLLVFGDREHFPNLCYLTGFDPRFEEALLVLDKSGNRTLLVGNEGLGYAVRVFGQPSAVTRSLWRSGSAGRSTPERDS